MFLYNLVNFTKAFSAYLVGFSACLVEITDGLDGLQSLI